MTSHGRHRRWLIVSFAVIAADQLAKHIIRSSFGIGEQLPLLGNIFYLQHVQNTGAAFSLFSGMNTALALLTGAVICWLLYLFLKSNNQPKLFYASLALIIAGAAGNLADRILFGAVTDFIGIWLWPTFNIADAAVTAGVFSIIALYWKR
jgi:signal peptidase II